MMSKIKEKNQLSMDRILNTDKITPSLVQYIVDKIVQEIHPKKIILFGSYARGDYKNDSDLDLFIEIKDEEESCRLIRRKIDLLLWGRKFPVDLFVRNQKEIERNIIAQNSFYTHHIFKEGKLLYESEGRDPGNLPFESITPKDAKEALDAADRIEDFVLKKIDIPFKDN